MADVRQMVVMISDVNYPGTELAEKLLSHLRPHALAESLNESDDVQSIGYMIMSVFRVDEKLGWLVWRDIDKALLVQKILSSQNYRGVGEGIGALFKGNKASSLFSVGSVAQVR